MLFFSFCFLLLFFTSNVCIFLSIMLLLSEEAGCLIFSSWNKSIMPKWQSVEVFFPIILPILLFWMRFFIYLYINNNTSITPSHLFSIWIILNSSFLDIYYIYIYICIYIYIYIYTNLISTSIHGTRKKKGKKKTPGTRDKSISNHRPGEKQKIIGQKERKGQPRPTPWKKIKVYAVSWSKEN